MTITSAGRSRQSRRSKWRFSKVRCGTFPHSSVADENQKINLHKLADDVKRRAKMEELRTAKVSGNCTCFPLRLIHLGIQTASLASPVAASTRQHSPLASSRIVG